MENETIGHTVFFENDDTGGGVTQDPKNATVRSFVSVF